MHVQLWLKVSDWASVWRMMSHASSGRKSWGSRGMTLMVRVVPLVVNSGLRVSRWKRTASLACCSSSALWQGMEMMTKCFWFIFINFTCYTNISYSPEGLEKSYKSKLYNRVLRNKLPPLALASLVRWILSECSGNILPHSAVASSVGRVSIIMLQKVAANVRFVAADLCFMACKVRWILMKIFFALAATSAAS